MQLVAYGTSMVAGTAHGKLLVPFAPAETALSFGRSLSGPAEACWLDPVTAVLGFSSAAVVRLVGSTAALLATPVGRYGLEPVTSEGRCIGERVFARTPYVHRVLQREGFLR